MPFENVHNYYEKLVYEEIRRLLVEKQRSHDDDFIEDLACVALNHLPPRYVRHNVDLIFYMNSDERTEINQRVQHEVAEAYAFVISHKEHQIDG